MSDQEIVAFVEARISEEERDARAATPGPWTTRNLGRHDQSAVLVDDGSHGPSGLPLGPAMVSTFGSHAATDARHIARQDPAATPPGARRYGRSSGCTTAAPETVQPAMP